MREKGEKPTPSSPHGVARANKEGAIAGLVIVWSAPGLSAILKWRKSTITRRALTLGCWSYMQALHKEMLSEASELHISMHRRTRGMWAKVKWKIVPRQWRTEPVIDSFEEDVTLVGFNFFPRPLQENWQNSNSWGDCGRRFSRIKNKNTGHGGEQILI